MRGSRFSATQDRIGNWTIIRVSDGASCYLQGDDAIEFSDNHRILDAIEYPSGPFQTLAEHIDASLSEYETVMQPARAKAAR
jgi:hypothetical protein